MLSPSPIHSPVGFTALRSAVPEGMRLGLICNAPWWLDNVWYLIKRFLPARTVAKLRVFRQGDAAFLQELHAHVEPTQVPRCFGGEAAEPWPFSEGGDVAVEQTGA